MALSETDALHHHRRKIFRNSVEDFSIHHCVIVTGSFRSGTSYICDCLEKNGLPNISHEKFSGFSSCRDPAQEDEFSQVLSDVVMTATEGFFFSKLMWPHRNDLALSLGYERGDSAQFAAIFPDAKWINIVRRDKIGQAISFWKAKTTNRWHIYKKDKTPEPQLDYDFNGIREAYVELSAHDLLWKDFYALAGCHVFSIEYEDFLASPQENLLALLEFIGPNRLIPPAIAFDANLKMQRNQQSEEIRERFLADFYKTGF